MELIARLRALELFERVYDSETNFVFVRCRSPGEAASIRAALARHLNVIVASTAPLGEPSGLRIGVGLHGDTDRLFGRIDRNQGQGDSDMNGSTGHGQRHGTSGGGT